MIVVSKYEASNRKIWDDIVSRSRNGNFLHLRKYMDYHEDRFQDYSLIIFSEDKPVAVFPANILDRKIVSHGGLTYGGLIYSDDLLSEEVLNIFHHICAYYKNNNIYRLVYKAIPHIFHRRPCEEDLYALYRIGGKLVRRDLSTAIDLKAQFSYSKGKKWSINKAKKMQLDVKKSTIPINFHHLLSETVKKFDAAPTHSLNEMMLLMDRFPEEIELFELYNKNELLAGAMIYNFGETVHTQYLAASDEGRKVGALDFLLDHLIRHEYINKCYLSFGVSTVNNGNELNSGLVAYKENFGGRAIVHDFYEVTL